MNHPIITHRSPLETLQVNLGYKCNQKCIHCHLDAGPHRKEMMERSTMEQIIHFLSSSTVKTVDLTGGAPELNPFFKDFVRELRGMGLQIIDRCNLTVLNILGREDFIKFLADQRVEIYASLPCYLKENVEYQRGHGVFDLSIDVLKDLNRIGYGKKSSGLVLNLVYNPLGPFLPPPQENLEENYRGYLKENYNIEFNHLLTIANMPIHRFKSLLISKGDYFTYLNLLKNAHSTENLNSVMCRKLINVDWQGYVYDCDFNQALGLPLQFKNLLKLHINKLNELTLEGNPILFRPHCYGCTAGQGSSCSGALNKGSSLNI
ncbi:MAG: arsenosugar biosynthesis radical SAM (seleno)protein ArsS [Thermodesulfobacteriota bacterium]